MPRLPVPRSDPQRPDAFGTARLFGSAVADGLADVSGALGRAGNAVDEFEARRKKLREEEEVSKFNRELATRKADFTIRQREMFEQAEPGDTEVAQRFVDSVEAEFAGMSSLAKTDAAKNFLKDQEAATVASFRVSAAAAEAELAGVRRAEETTDATAALSAAIVSDPDEFENSLFQLNSALETLLPAERPRVRLAEQSALVEARVEGLITTKKRPQQAFDELKAGRFDQFIDGNTKARLMRSAQSAVKAETDFSRGLALLELQDDLGQIARTGDPGRWSKEAVRALADDPVEAKRLERAFDQSLAVGTATAQFESMTLPEIAEDLRASEAGLATAPEFETASSVARAKRTAAAAVAEGYRNDPAGTAIRRNSALATAFSEFEAAPSPQSFQRYAVLAEKQQQRDLPGAPARVLPEAFIDNARNQLTLTGASDDAARAARFLGQLQQVTGPAFWTKAVRDLKDADVLTSEQFVAANLVQTKPSLAREVIELSTLTEAKLKEIGVSDSQRTNARALAQGALAEFRKTLPPRDLDVAAAYQDTAERLILARQARGAKVDAKKIARDLVLGEFTFKGTLRVPKGRDANRIKQSLDAEKRALVSDLLIAPPGDGDYGARVRAAGFWLTNGDETGARLVDETGAAVLARGPDGRAIPIVRRWEDLD